MKSMRPALLLLVMLALSLVIPCPVEAQTGTASTRVSYVPTVTSAVFAAQGDVVAGMLNAVVYDTSKTPARVITGAAVSYFEGSRPVAAGAVLSGGTHLLTAQYAGGNGYAASVASARITITAAPVHLSYVPTVRTVAYPTVMPASDLTATALDAKRATVNGTFTFTENGGPINSTTVLRIGVHTINVHFAPAKDANGSTDYATPPDVNSTITVRAGVVTLTLGVCPSVAIGYGTPLPSTCPTATARDIAGNVVAGTWKFTDSALTGPAIAPGAVLVGGNHNILFSFTPSSANYAKPAVKSVAVAVTAVTPTVHFTPTTALNTGQKIPSWVALKEATIDNNPNGSGTMVPAGAWAFTPAVGTLVTATTGTTLVLHATWTPTDKRNYASVSASVTVTVGASGPAYTMALTLSDGAQLTTLAFDGLAIMEGNLDSQSFFPPGKVADYTGFQYLRDNDLDNMGHNTDFLTRVANNVLYILNDSQLAQMKILAAAQQDEINLYGYKRYILMQAFRRTLTGDIPAGSAGLNLNAVKSVSNALYLLDGQIAFERALLYANIYNSMDSTQIAYLAAMKGKGFNSWPVISDDQVRSKTAGMTNGEVVAMMTYAGDLFSWYAGTIDADVYFCPERHGTYYGGFYMKDAPAVGHAGYSISEQLTASSGRALSDPAAGYVTAGQAAIMGNLLSTQRNNLYAGATNIVGARTQIATLLRSLRISTAGTDGIKAQVLALSGTYGDLDGEDNYHYATTFAQVYASLTDAQKTKLQTLWNSILTGSYADGTPFDYSNCTTPFLYSAVITDVSVLSPYIDNTDYLFFEP